MNLRLALSIFHTDMLPNKYRFHQRMCHHWHQLLMCIFCQHFRLRNSVSKSMFHNHSGKIQHQYSFLLRLVMRLYVLDYLTILSLQILVNHSPLQCFLRNLLLHQILQLLYWNLPHLVLYEKTVCQVLSLLPSLPAEVFHDTEAEQNQLSLFQYLSA